MKKFFKKPLNIVSVALAVLGLVGILVMLIVPHGGKYTYKTEVGGTEVKHTVTFKSDKFYSGDDDGIGVKYEIKDGKLYLNGSSVASAKINAFKITVGEGDGAMVYKCVMTDVFFAIACAMTVAGAAGIVYGALTLKKKKK